MAVIRWREVDIKKLGIYVRKFNAAITRLEKASPEIKDSGALPSRKSVSDLKESILTRKQFNRELSSIDRFFKKGARDIAKDPFGVRKTKWQINEERFMVQRVNRSRAKIAKEAKLSQIETKKLDLAKIDIKERVGYIKAREGRTGDSENAMAEWEALLYGIGREAGDRYYDALYMKTLNGYYRAITQELGGKEADDLVKMLKDMDLKGYELLYILGEDDTLAWEYIYNTADRIDKLVGLAQKWPKALEDYRKRASKRRLRNK